MRLKARTDYNQKLIVDQLRKLGVSVAVTSMLGKGFPDLVLGYQNRNFLVELKDGAKPKSQKGLTMDEAKFFTTWKGSVCKCENIDEILKYIEYVG
jgi:hypothetical protein